MNRRTWWTAMLAACGIAKAQEISTATTDCPDCVITYTQDGRRIAVQVSPNGMQKPTNNQCPACGTMAKPYKPTHGVTLWAGEPPLIVAGPSPDRDKQVRLTRCEWCNCAFWQDEEPSK